MNLPINNRYGTPIDRYLIPLVSLNSYGIYDTEEKCFVKTWGSGKTCWAKQNHASCAFFNATSMKIGDQTRYIVKLIG